MPGARDATGRRRQERGLPAVLLVAGVLAAIAIGLCGRTVLLTPGKLLPRTSLRGALAWTGPRTAAGSIWSAGRARPAQPVGAVRSSDDDCRDVYAPSGAAALGPCDGLAWSRRSGSFVLLWSTAGVIGRPGGSLEALPEQGPRSSLHTDWGTGLVMLATSEARGTVAVTRVAPALGEAADAPCVAICGAGCAVLAVRTEGGVTRVLVSPGAGLVRVLRGGVDGSVAESEVRLPTDAMVVDGALDSSGDAVVWCRRGGNAERATELWRWRRGAHRDLSRAQVAVDRGVLSPEGDAFAYWPAGGPTPHDRPVLCSLASLDWLEP